MKIMILQRYYYYYYYKNNNDDHEETTPSLRITLNARFYALLVTAFWLTALQFPQAMTFYLCWHILSSNVEMTTHHHQWQQQQQQDMYQLHQALRAEYEQIMASDDDDGSSSSSNNNDVPTHGPTKNHFSDPSAAVSFAAVSVPRTCT